MTDRRKRGQSQLDYLWTTYGGYEVSNEISKTPSNEVILTEEAVANKLLDFSTDVTIDSEENANNTITLIIRDQQGSVISHTTINKGTGVVDFVKFISTDKDVDKGLVSKSGLICLKIVDSTQKEHIIELFPEVTGSESNSIITSVVENKIASQLKIDNPIVEKSVEIRQSSNGIQANLVVNEQSSVKVDKTKEGILVHQTWEGETIDLKCRFIKSNDYLLLKDIDNGTIYFLEDKPYIYFRNVKYGSISEFAGGEDFYTKDQIDELLSTMSVEEANKIITEIFK